MRSPELERVLALPPVEQAMLSLLLVHHAPISRTRMAPLFAQRRLRNPATSRPYVPAELRPSVDAWHAQGLVFMPSGTGSLGQYALRPSLQHELATHLGASALAELATFIRASEPNSTMVGAAHHELLRELFLSLYLEPVAWLKRALELHRPDRHEPAGALFVEAFGVNPPAACLTRIGPSRASAFLATLIDDALRGPARLGAEVLDYVASARDTLGSRVLADVAYCASLAGGFERARTLASTRDDAELYAARCFLALAEGRFDQARQEAGAAVASLPPKQSAARRVQSSARWPWVTLALLTSTGDARAPQIGQAQLSSMERRRPEQAVVVAALSTLAGHVTAERAHTALLYRQYAEQAEDWLGLALWGLVLGFSERRPPGALVQRLERQQQRAADAGLAWLADELARLACFAADPTGSPRGLASMYAREAPWERALRTLEGAVAQARVEESDDDAGLQGDERLAWVLTVGASGGLAVTPRVQTRAARGYAEGRRVDWKALYEGGLEAALLCDDDRRVVRAIRAVDAGGAGRSYELAPPGIVALVGHPRVFADLACQSATVVLRGEVRVDVRQAEGDTVIALQPSACREHEVAGERRGARTWLYALTSRQRTIARQLPSEGLRLPPEARERAQRMLGDLALHFEVSSELPPVPDAELEVATDSRIHVQLRRSKTGLHARLCVQPLGSGPRFTPGVGGLHVLGTRASSAGAMAVRCTRDPDAEQRALSELLSACPSLVGMSVERCELALSDLPQCLALLSELRAIADEAIVEWPEGQPLRIVAECELRQLSLRVRQHGDWFSAEGELEIDPTHKLGFHTLLARLRERVGRFVRLDDDHFVALGESLLRSLEGALALSRVHDGQLELHPLALLTSTALQDARLDCDDASTARLARAREAAAYEPTLPRTFEATLRPYQHEGYRFLSRLARAGLGACLADDMGLGKTLQTLALLLERAAGGPSLVVAPTSVCRNWLDEARKFAPTLRMVRLGAAARVQTLERLEPFDVLVCSYGVLQQERARLARTRFAVVVLDEAQSIKNPSTQRSQAAFALDAEVRIALTGTPLENQLGDLWSLSNFLNPGLLGTRRSFDQRFATPIQRDGDRAAAQLLRRIITPFVLRRSKREVLAELPEKTVITVHVEPSPEERALFAALREQALARSLEPNQSSEARLRLLAELTRMRRAACHPELVVPGQAIASSKLATLERLLAELLASGHRVLVFSQFVDYLALVRARLDELRIRHQYLDGSHSANARAASVAAFQAGASEVFLISLKAGGVGLNLTAADYVIHLDPWWNPAVEDQASDRAHRIGQTRPVTIARLVMAGSVEPKILALHASKRELSEDLLADTGRAGALSLEQLTQLLTEGDDEGPPRGSGARDHVADRAGDLR
jgi:superfamily II DNA or RNA helicase